MHGRTGVVASARPLPSATAVRRRRLAAFAVVLGVLASPVALPATDAEAAHDAHPVATAAAVQADDTRLLVTYTAPVDGAAEAGAFTTASVLAAEDIATSAVQVLDFPTARDAARAARDLASRPDVVAVEVDQWVRPDSELHRIVALDQAQTASAPPPSWGVANDGRAIDGRVGRAGVDVGAARAARHATGRGVVVAVIDSGVDIDHPLLRDRIWTNPREARDGRDTDGNGYVDDLHGWNFARNTNRVFDDAVRDAHGTHVAGIIAARAESRIGFASVAPDARIMPLKFIDGEAGRLSDAIAAIRYAIDNGAHLINASWGADQPSNALRQVLAETPIPVVLSAGNHGQPIERKPTYPAAYGLDTTISVAAIAHDGTMAPFSTTSAQVIDVAAPGARILGPYPGSRMAVASGTSQAAPHVSGALALAMQRHSHLAPTEAKRAVRATVRPLRGARDTVAGGIVRGPALLDHLGTRVTACDAAQLRTMPFRDVSATSPHRDAVACLVALDITRGVSDTAFGSERGLTRAQIATLVARTFSQVGALPEAPARGRFTDVAADNVHRDAIESLAAIGVVTGDSATRFAPDRTTTRAELAAVVARAAEYLADGEVRARGPVFVDTAGVVELAEIDKAAGLRIVLGRDDGQFQPGVPVRRDQAASMVARLLDRWTQQGLIGAA